MKSIRFIPDFIHKYFIKRTCSQNCNTIAAFFFNDVLNFHNYKKALSGFVAL